MVTCKTSYAKHIVWPGMKAYKPYAECLAKYRYNPLDRDFLRCHQNYMAVRESSQEFASNGFGGKQPVIYFQQSPTDEDMYSCSEVKLEWMSPEL